VHSAGNVGRGVRAGVARVRRVIGVGSRLSLHSALVLEPDSYRFYFPVISDNNRRCQLSVDKTR
jgi:hypothetical protein